ncbi:disease resistance protein RUN1-like [Rosa chinensis]|uniref:disease resistance protein RUN1-like n=1 Tax=Rosa chinensis TaxID=74649 RepID=UPI000D0971E3|nr:disease resistance protein RUN1-like [Rosa chinensis]
MSHKREFDPDDPYTQIASTSSAMDYSNTEIGSSSSSDSSASDLKLYDVFLSFRGEDTRHSFTDHLYYALNKMGIHTFRDAEKLRKGEAIGPALLESIEESRFAVVILSPEYASSAWCLDELAHIIKCKKESGLEVYPVFYHVQPSEVRWQKTGKFREAFDKHEERYRGTTDRVTNWRIALSEVANLSGWDLQNRPETEVIQEIAGKISYILHFMVPSASNNRVGIDVRIETLKNYLALWSTHDIRSIGIWGMGGIGKTTLAEEVFQRFRNRFDASAFVANVRLEARNGLVHLQKILSASLLESDNNIPCVKIGSGLLRKRLKQKVLIILDDVDEAKQIEALTVRGLHRFGQGSRLIITTRDKQPLLAWGVQKDNIYEVEKLTDDEALQLLCQKAFHSKHAPDDYKELSNKLLNYVSGLPLALEVLGSYLFGRQVSEWLEALARLDEDPEKDIFNKLKISYDGLSTTQKKIFLDIACFFRGQDEAPVRKILKSCRFFPDIGINDLVYKSLLKIEKNKLWMHDLLQQMGWHIVRQESLQDPGKRSRLWLNDNTYLYERNESWLDKDACDVLKENTGTEVVEGMFLRSPEKLEIYLNADPFSNMRYLRLLKICNVKFFGAPFIHLSKHLRVLEWHECPLEALPSSCQPDRLVELKMPNSRIEQLWDERLALKMLVLIDLSYCQYLRRTLDFSTVPNLERLNFEGCKRLSEVHPTIGDLKHLVLLNMKNCESLESLINSISLASLETFILSGCSKLKEFPEIVGMESLAELYLDGTAIKELPTSIQHLSGLILLNLKGCKYLLGLPSFICNLVSLKYLYLSGCSRIDQLPEHLGSLEHLQVLDACKTAIRKVPSSILLLKNPKQLCFPGSNDLQMEFSESSGLRYSSSHLCSLMALDIPDDIFCCGSDLNEDKMLISKPEIISNGNLQELDTWSTLNWSCSFRETDLTNNFHLMLSDTSPQMFFDSCQYSSLTSLLLIGCNLGEGAIPDDIGCLYSLHLLDLSENNFVSIPETIFQLSKLRKLLLFRCSKLQSLPKQLPLSLKRVIARYCPMLRTTYPNTIVKWSSDEGFSFIDCRYSDEHADDDEGHMFLHKIIEDRIHHDKPFEIRFRPSRLRHPLLYGSPYFFNEVGVSRGDRIPDWCTHWNTGSSVTLQLTGPEDKANSTWMGLALFVAFINSLKYQVKAILSCHLRIDEGDPQIPLVFQDLDDNSVELCCYLPRCCGQFAGQLDKASIINVTFIPTTPGMHVTFCGIQPISEHDAPMFAQDLTWTAFSDFKYTSCPQFKRMSDKATKLENSGDVMVPAYNPLNVNQHKWKIDHDIQPRVEEELQLLELLRGLYKGSNGRQKKFHFCFPDPVISPWFINHYAGNVALCDLPQNLIDDKRWVGLEVYVVFTWSPTSDYSDHNLSFLHVDLSAHESSVMHSSIKIESCFGSYQLVVLHVPRMHFPEQLTHYQGISTLFTTSTPIVEIQVCGSRLVYEHDLEDLILSLTACTLRKPHSIGLVYSQAQIYVETIEEKADKNIQCNAEEGEMSTDGHSSFQRSIKQIEVPDKVRSSILQKYRCYIQGKQGILDSDKIIVHSKSLLLDNSIKKNFTGKESIMSSLACHHLHIVAETHSWGSDSALRWKRCLELLLQYSEVATLSLNGHVISVMKHFSPSSPFNFCFRQNEVLLHWITDRGRIRNRPGLYGNKSLRGLVICATFSFHGDSAMNNLASEMTVELVCHLSDDDSRFCVNAAPMLTITKEKFEWFYFRDFMWLTYIPLVMLAEVKVISDIRADVSSNCPGLMVHRHYTCVLYRQEEEEFKQAITQCWTSFLDNMDLHRRYKQRLIKARRDEA